MADSIGTSLTDEGAGSASISTSSKDAPICNDWARPDGPADVEGIGPPWLEAFCKGKTDELASRYSSDGLPIGHNSSVLEGLGLLKGEPPARAAPWDRMRRPRVRMGGCESLTADERVVGRWLIFGYQKKMQKIVLRDLGKGIEG